MNFKKLMAVILTGVLSAGVLAGCGGAKTEEAKNEGTDTSLTDVKEKGKLTLGLDADFAPMGFTEDDGTIVGFDIDLANEVAAKIGVALEVKPIDWDSKNLELSSKKIDVIWNGFSVTDERRREVLFSTPYLTTGQVIVVKNGSDIKTKEDIKGKKIALQDGSTSEDALKANTEIYEAIGDENISRFKENSQVLMEVDSGRADAAIIDEIFVRYYLTKENMADKYTVLESLGDEDYAVGGRQGDAALMEAISKALDECKAEGKISEISQKWFGEDLTK